jgi:phospholipid/cholesterol/gamma-HCH transport system permease protein
VERGVAGEAQLELGEDRVLLLQGALVRESVPGLYRQASGISTEIPSLIDLSGVEKTDSAGVALLDWMGRRFDQATFQGESKQVARARELYGAESRPLERPSGEQNLFARAGSAAISAGRSGVEYLQLAADTTHWLLPGIFRSRHQRRGSFTEQCLRLGSESTAIVAILSFIIGLILALQSSVQLVQFGAGIFVADLLAISVIREMGPMMTAVIVAGRSGSSIASEIATMRVTEELDALEVMGINPVRYTVVPRILAGMTTVPILTVIAIVTALVGGGLVSVAYLRLSPAIFVTQLSRAAGFDDLIVALVKSVVFAWQIVMIAGFYGLRATGGAEGVGKVTTSSVVASIFAVIVIDVLFSFLYIL